MAYQESPIDRAQSASSYLHALCDLLTQASDSRDMHQVDPNHLAMLLDHILNQLDEALGELARQGSRPGLRSV